MPTPILPTPRRHSRRSIASKALLLTAVAAVLLIGVSALSRASLGMNASAACEVSKLKAAGKYASCRLKVASKATARQASPFFDVCDSKFATQWTKVEATGGPACPTRDDSEWVSTEIRKAADEGRIATGSSVETAPCAATQQKTLATYLKCALNAYAKARKSGQSLSLSLCALKLDKASATAATRFPSACGLTSVGTLRDHLNVRVANIAQHLSGVPVPTPPPSTCGDGQLDPPDEECDGANARDCPGQCRADCSCPNQAARVEMTVEIAQIAGRPGHEGLFPSSAQPVWGESYYVVASMSGPYATSSFRFVDVNDQLIAPAILTTDNRMAGTDEYVGNVTLPTQPFKLAASGTTRDGSAYDIVGERLFTPQPINVTWDPPTGPLPPGGSTTLRFTIANHGPAATFNVSASDTLGLAPAASPAIVTLAPNETATISVLLTAPVNPRVWVADVTLTVTNAGDVGITNSSFVRVTLR